METLFKQNKSDTENFLVKRFDGCSIIKCFFLSGSKFSKKNISEHGYALNEKNKLKLMFGLREKQFKNYVLEALRKKNEDAFLTIIKGLETRLDNTVYRMGFAVTRASGRQMVNHGHILINGKKATIPSMKVGLGDKISIKPSSLEKPLFKNLDIVLKKYQLPSWIKLDKNKKEGEILSFPSIETRNEYKVDIQSIIEFYLK